MKNIVIIPTYNEIKNVPRMAKELRTLYPTLTILFVDDNSPDGTGDLIHDLKAEDDKIHLLRRSEKTGLGSAYTAGFKWAKEQHVETVITMDCDFSHDPKDVKTLQSALDSGDCDVAVGSRYIQGIRILNWSFKRLLLSYMASLYSKGWLGLPIHDPTSGFNGYKLPVLNRYLDSCSVRFNGYVFQVLMKYFAWKKGYVVKEYPITFSEREIGETKMNYSIILEAIWGVFVMKFKVRKAKKKA